jgi:hypothetical protein
MNFFSNHVAPSIRKKLALTSLKSGGRSVGIVRLQTKAAELLLLVTYLILPAALGPGVFSASNRNQYQKQKSNVSGK